MHLHQFAVSGFAYKLNQQQREALLKLLVKMAAVDYDLSVEEENFLIAWATEWHLPLDLTPEKEESDADLLALFDDYPAKVIALQEIVKLSYQDGHFGEEEREKATKIARQLGLNHVDLLTEINQWVRAWYDWHYVGEQLLDAENWLKYGR